MSDSVTVCPGSSTLRFLPGPAASIFLAKLELIPTIAIA